MRNTVIWPADAETGEVFDLGWLDAGTRPSLTAEEEAVLRRATRVVDPAAELWAKGVSPRVRTEYERRRRISRFGEEFAHQSRAKLRAGDVRGIFYLEWRGHIEHLSRTGYFETALALTYEVIDAAERVAHLEGLDIGAAGWYKRAAVLLRKLRDYEAEVRMIEDIEKRFPTRNYLGDRKARAVELLAAARENG